MSDEEPRPPEVGHFWRPSPPINRLVEVVSALFPPQPLELATLECLQQRSISSFRALGASGVALELALLECEWRVSSGRAPADAWGGEVLRRDPDPPLVVLYRDSPLTRVPGRRIFELAFQLTVDHMFGHLYEYYSGASDWGEEPATRWQYRVLRKRGGLVNDLTALVMVISSRFHKQIPFSNYRAPRLTER
jgi:hypothetical protein